MYINSLAYEPTTDIQISQREFISGKITNGNTTQTMAIDNGN